MLKRIDISRAKRSIIDLKKPNTEQFNSPFKVTRLAKDPPYRESMKKIWSTGKKTGSVKSFQLPKKKRFALLNLLFILLMLLVAATIAGFFVFSPKGPAAKYLKLFLTSPNEITAGENFSISLAYENLNTTELNQIEVVVEYPENYFFESATPTPLNAEKNVWQLAALAPGEKQTIELVGYLVGNVKDKKNFKVILHYRPANFSSDFQETLNKEITIKESLLQVTVTAPTTSEAGQEIPIIVNYQNNSKTSLENLFFAFDLGQAFSLNQASSSAGAGIWQIKKLASGQAGEFNIKGKVDSTPASWRWFFNVWQEATAQSTSTIDFSEASLEKRAGVRFYYKASGQVVIKAPAVSVKLTSAQQEQAVGWGGRIDYQIELENSGETAINQPLLKLTFPKGLIDWPAFENQTNAKLEEQSNSLVWLSSFGGWAEKLSQIKPQDKLQLVVTIPISAEPEDLVDLSVDDLLVEAVATLSFKENDQPKEISSAKLKNQIVSQLNLITEALYYLDEETEVGSGPLPPVIGQTTSYRLYWKLFSGSSALKQVQIKTTLPPYSNWQAATAEVTMGSPLSFDETSKEVIWNIDELSANSQVMASFNVQVVPVESQVNQLLILTNPTTLQATDQNNQIVTKTNNLITSDLINDEFAQGQGLVTVGQ